MHESEVRSRIIQIFEKNRQDPAGPFEEKGFLKFLLNPPAKKSIRSSFRGCRVQIKFLNDVQSELRMCFSNDDYDKDWSLDKFVEHVTRKAGNRSATIALVNKRYKQARSSLFVSNIMVCIFVGVLCAYILVPFFAILSGFLGTGIIMIGPVLVWLAVVFLVYRLTYTDFAYYRSLKKEINKSEA